MTNQLQGVKWQSMVVTNPIDELDKNYRCEKCGQQYKFAKQLRNHFRDQHAY